MSRSRCTVFGIVILSAMSLAVTAGGAPPTKDKDPQASYEPKSEPGEGQKFLARFVGQWEVVKTFYPRSGEPVQTKGECRQTMINGGRFLESEFVFHQDGKDGTGLGVIGFEPDGGKFKFTSFWTDSRSTRMSVRQSEDKFNGEEIVLFSRSLDPDSKDARRSRTNTHMEDEGRKIIHRQSSIAADGKERLVMEMVLTRKAESPKPGD
jgi:hypothetical protein